MTEAKVVYFPENLWEILESRVSKSFAKISDFHLISVLFLYFSCFLRSSDII